MDSSSKMDKVYYLLLLFLYFLILFFRVSGLSRDKRGDVSMKFSVMVVKKQSTKEKIMLKIKTEK